MLFSKTGVQLLYSDIHWSPVVANWLFWQGLSDETIPRKMIKHVLSAKSSQTERVDAARWSHDVPKPNIDALYGHMWRKQCISNAWDGYTLHPLESVTKMMGFMTSRFRPVSKKWLGAPRKPFFLLELKIQKGIWGESFPKNPRIYHEVFGGSDP